VTLLVGIHCTDGVVVAADSASTFGSAAGAFTITHPVRKIEIIENELIVAGTGQVGLGQRFVAAAEKLYKSKEYAGSAIDKAKLMATKGLQDLQHTGAQRGNFGALVSFLHQGKAELCELQVSDFQPEMKGERCWYVSMGSGQSLADPYLALMRMAFWNDGPPGLQSGIFAAAWVMHHAIEAAPGFVRIPIDIAILSDEDKKARLLERDELEEHLTHVKASMEHFRAFEKILQEEADAPALPDPPP
jgi:20S proteasome alpha/beta subunit